MQCGKARGGPGLGRLSVILDASRTDADYVRPDLPGAGDLAYMLRYKHDCNETYCTECAVDLTRELHPGLLNFEQWLAENALRGLAKGG